MQPIGFVRRFRFWSVLTVISIYLLILVGGVVRASGSGMGCPDWPKCFGQWVPPTDIKQLPADYKQVYLAQRVRKNQKLARMLASLGFREVAGEIFAHPTQYVETEFNATKTWIEYVNRLVGVLIGIFVFITAVVALPYWRRDRVVFWLAVGGWLLTGVQGWLGSLVVSTNLLPIMVTIHMGLALLIVAMLLYAADRARQEPVQSSLVGAEWLEQPQHINDNPRGLQTLLWVLLMATFAQIILGTQVREQIDHISAAADYAGRANWVDQLGSVFKVHRSFSILIALLNGYAVFKLWPLTGRVRQLAVSIVGLVALEIVAGIVLAYFALPAVVQPIHLTLATMLFGAQFLVLLAHHRTVITSQKVRLRPAHV
jgi:cytochrome c oxidase assembly protein subunit 15